MNSFQFLGIALFAALISASLNRVIRRRSISRSSLVWLAVWSAGISALIAPDQLTRVARAVGVSRGADLLLYVSVLSGLLVAFVIYTRMRRTDREITIIVRQMALSTVEVPVGFGAAAIEPFEEMDAENPFFGSAVESEVESHHDEVDPDEL